MPRSYQLDTMRAFFVDGYKNFIDIEHRRAGKDKKWLNIIIAASQQRVGLYLHTLPSRAHAKRVIWDGIDSEGKRFLDHIPPQLIDKVNNTDLSILFKNGSVLKLAGADYYDSWMGTNPVFVGYSEYSIQDPKAAEYFAPILAENGGWQAYFYTPRAKNHGWKLYITNINNPKWFVQRLTVDDTKRADGSPVITQEAIEEQRGAVLSDEMIQQEYYCSFDAAIEGAIFGKELRQLRDQARISDFVIDRTIPVSTFWDIGRRDHTAIWWIQFDKSTGIYNVINYYDDWNKSAQFYANYVLDYRSRMGIVYDRHFGPHDISKREFLTEKNIMDSMEDLGVPFVRVPRIQHKQDAINMAKTALYNCRFHEKNCFKGISALQEYHAKFDPEKAIYSEPVHNWASHAADAFMQFAQSHMQMNTQNGRILYNAVNNYY